VGAVFRYLGPAFAVLLFTHVGVLGVAWLRIASSAVVLAIWRRPWRLSFDGASGRIRHLAALGVVLALMNASFYLAIARLPLGTVGAIEFIGQITLAALGVRTRRNLVALVLAASGGGLLTHLQLASQPLGLLFALANCVLFVLYVLLAHRLAEEGGRAGVDRLAASMLVALVVITPVGLKEALPAFGRASLLLAGLGVGLCSSVVPSITDQLAMAVLPRATFALRLALLPAAAAAMGALVLRQIPAPNEIIGMLLVTAGVAVHQERHCLEEVK